VPEKEKAGAKLPHSNEVIYKITYIAILHEKSRIKLQNLDLRAAILVTLDKC
jgi:hypothetical protein